jgi:hypothetical protein
MTERRHWLTHPGQAWRAFAERIDARADTEAAAAGLTVEHLPNGVRRYRDPRLDHLAAHRAQPTATDEAGAWSTPNCAVEPHVGPDAPANRIPVRLRRADPSAGAGAVPPPTVPHQGHSGFACVSHATALRAALDPGHPATAVSAAPTSSREEHAPARPETGPRNHQ